MVGGVGQGPNGVNNADWNLMPGLSTRPATEWGQLLYTTNDGTTSNFNALIFTLKQRYKGLSYQANYNFESAKQWAPTYNDTSGGNKAFWPGAYAAHTYYGPTSTDIKNSFSFGGDYEVPKFGCDRHYLNQLAGLRISTITVAQTGTPFSVGNTSGPLLCIRQQFGHRWRRYRNTGVPTLSRCTEEGILAQAGVSDRSLYGRNLDRSYGAGTAPVLSTQGANTFRNPWILQRQRGHCQDLRRTVDWRRIFEVHNACGLHQCSEPHKLGSDRQRYCLQPEFRILNLHV